MSKIKELTPQIIHLPADLTPANLSEYSAQLGRCLDGCSKELRVDCSSILQVSSSHIGLLWQAFVDCSQKNVSLTLESASDGLKRVLATLDIADIFGVSVPKAEWNEQNNEHTLEFLTEQRFNDRIKVSKLGLEIFLSRFSSFLRTIGIPQNLGYELRTVLYEIITNVCNYSGLDESAFIEFTALADGQGIIITIKDKGLSFDPTKHEGATDFESAARAGQFRGFGLMMVKKMVNKFQYSRTNDGQNLLMLMKSWSK